MNATSSEHPLFNWLQPTQSETEQTRVSFEPHEPPPTPTSPRRSYERQMNTSIPHNYPSAGEKDEIDSQMVDLEVQSHGLSSPATLSHLAADSPPSHSQHTLTSYPKKPRAQGKKTKTKRKTCASERFHRFVEYSERLRPALVLENAGSTARDHLASERTFLAYVRTSLALASMGVALVQLFTIADFADERFQIGVSAANQRLTKFARPLGGTMVLFGLMVLVIGFYRYFFVQNALTHGKFPAARTCIVFITFVITTVVSIIFGLMISSKLKSA